jgi:hypothetical protein
MTITKIKDRSLTIGDILGLSALDFSGTDVDFAKMLTTPMEALKGFEEGYNERGDVITETTDGAPLNAMWDEFQRTIRMWNSQRDALTNILTFNVTTLIESVRYPIEQDFEEASEFGEPKGIRLGPAFRMGYDFKWWDIAIRYTWMFLAESSQQQLVALNNTALEADNRLMFTRVMKQIFNSTTKVADIDGEVVNVYPFYNGDTMVPPKWKNTVHTSGHNHYLESGAATVDPGDLQAMADHLLHHGYNMAAGYRLVLMVNAAQGATIRTFRAGTASALYDFIPSQNYGGGIYIPSNGGIIGAPTLANIPGLNTIGSYGPFSIVEEDYIPAGFMFAFATGGEMAIGNPVGIRQHENASLQGLRLVKGRDNDYPLIDSYYLHGMGTGIRHRGAGVVMEIGNGGTYTVPAAYA